MIATERFIEILAAADTSDDDDVALRAAIVEPCGKMPLISMSSLDAMHDAYAIHPKVGVRGKVSVGGKPSFPRGLRLIMITASAQPD
jgi:hypothetical protein